MPSPRTTEANRYVGVNQTLMTDEKCSIKDSIMAKYVK